MSHREDIQLVDGETRNKGTHSTLKLVIICIIVLVVSLVAGLLIGYYGHTVRDKIVNKDIPAVESDGVFLKGVSPKIISEADPAISDALLKEINADKIRDYLRNLTAHPHLAGTNASKQQAYQIKDDWLSYGFDRADVLEYSVLLSYPKKDDPSLIKLMNGTGSLVYTSQVKEKVLRPEENQTDVVPPFNSYSPPGNVTSGRLIYVNYGREEDFHWLKNNKSMNFNDSIVIARYGKIFRANKVQTAEHYGAKAIILYSDPYDYTNQTEKAYPESWWLPGTGVQRGTVMLESGDPLTPFYPSIDSAYEEDVTRGDILPKIPVHPIGYDDAKAFLEYLDGEEAPLSWQGSIANLTYRIGPDFSDTNMTINVYVTTHNVKRKVYTTVGYIEGAVEPDRYVVVGNHRDAWVFGALDPSSGTAAMMEVARALRAVMTDHNWRPRRTILFCSWAAEEYGLVGSVEFVEHFAKALGQRAVAYLNVDILLEGLDSIRFKATPSLHPVIREAAKKVANPDELEVAAGRKTLYDTWKHVEPDKDDPNEPNVRLIGSGSDYTWFLQVLGVPCLEPRYTYSSNLSSYPLYHSVHETFYLVNNIMDPGFKYSRSVAQVWGELVRNVADALILPFNVTSLSNFLSKNSDVIVSKYEDLLNKQNLSQQLEYFKIAVKTFANDTADFESRLKLVNHMSPYAVRQVNDQLMSLQRGFLDPQGLPGRPYFKNVLSAPSQFDSYSGSVFPGLVDALFRIDDAENPEERWTVVKRQLAAITYIIETVSSTLRKSIEFTKLQ